MHAALRVRVKVAPDGPQVRKRARQRMLKMLSCGRRCDWVLCMCECGSPAWEIWLASVYQKLTSEPHVGRL